MKNDKKCFVAVEFVDDDNVRGYFYWYLCEIADVQVGDAVMAPLGRHNNLQQGLVRKVIFEPEYNAPYPMFGIKCIRRILKGEIQDV